MDENHLEVIHTGDSTKRRAGRARTFVEMGGTMLGIAAGILVGAVSGVAFYCLLCRNAEYIDAFDEDLVRERFMEDMNNKTRME